MTVALEVLGRPVEVACDEAETARLLGDVLADLLAAPAPDTEAEPERISFRGPVSAAALRDLMATLEGCVLRYGAGHLMPRAAAVAHPDGSVALLCGGPVQGASLVAAALVRAGHAHLADPIVVLDPETLELLPVRLPVALSGTSRERYAARPPWAGPGDPWLVPASAIATVPLPDEPLEPRVLVFAEHVPHLPRPQVLPLAGGEAAYLLGSRSARLGEVAGGALPALARLARRVPAFRLRYDHDASAAEEVIRLWSTA